MQRRSGWPALVSCALMAAGLFTGGCGSAKTSDSENNGTQASAARAKTGPTKHIRPRNVNVVIFLIDTLRADRVGTYGYEQPTTPSIDALAAQGVVFEQAYSPAPWTLPTVASLLTSTFLCEHGVLIDGQKIAAAAQPLARRLKEIGYQTGSFYRNPYVGPMTDLHRGYDVCTPAKRQVNRLTVERWLGRLQPGPFYLYIHNTEPHDPWLAGEQAVRRFGNAGPRLRQRVELLFRGFRRLTRADYNARQPLGTTDNSAQQQAAMLRLAELKPKINLLYDARVLEADANVGSVIAALQQHGVWDKTLFIVLSDHGEEFGEHAGWQHDQSVYEELVRVPLVVRFPSDEFAGRRVRPPISLVDIMPTIFDYLGRSELSANCRGESLMPLVRGEWSGDPQAMKVVALRHNMKKYYRPFKETRGDVNVVIRQGGWKGIWNVEPDTLELYDLAKDPGEKTDLSAKQAERAQAMRAFAQKWLEACATGQMDAGQGGIEQLDEATRRRLEALGYLGGDEDDEDEHEHEHETREGDAGEEDAPSP